MSSIREKTTLIGIAAILHDIGKMYQKVDEKLPSGWRNGLVSDGYTHALLTEYVLERLLGKNSRLRGLWTKHFGTDIVIISASHHNPPNEMPAKIIQEADCIAAGLDRKFEKEYDEREGNYKKVTLSPILNHICLWGKDTERNYRNKIGLFSTETLFPVERSLADGQASGYEKCIAEFERGFNLLNNHFEQDGNLDFFAEGLETLLLNTTAFMPASAWRDYDEVSLFDHNKTTAAFAASIYKTGLKKGTDGSYLLIRGEFFGIQNFIFNKEGSNENPAKILRGKSFYVSLMSEVASLLIIRELNLPIFNVMFNAAGAFVILADNTEETRNILGKIRKDISDWLYKKYYGMVYLGIAEKPASKDSIVNDFHELWEDLIYEVSKYKSSKFDLPSQNALFENYHKRFDGELKECSYCGIEPAINSDGACKNCKDFERLGKDLTDKSTLYFYPDETGIFGKINCTFDLDPKRKDIISKLNIDMGSEYNGLRTVHYRSCVDLDKDDTATSFDDLAKSAEGANMLGVLKADVDNLGMVFAVGLIEEDENSKENEKHKETFSRISAVSRNIHFFFSYYISELAKKKQYKIYTVFAGGDDLFIVGAYDHIVELAIEIADEFKRYTGNNPEITLSAGIGCFKPNIPIWFMAEKTEELLKKAKNHSKDQKDKGRIAIFESVCEWDKFKQRREKFEKIVELLQNDDNVVSTSLYYKLLEFTDNQIKFNDKQTPELLMWRPRLRYHIARQKLRRGIDTQENRNKICLDLHDWIEKQPELLKTFVFLKLYKNR